MLNHNLSDLPEAHTVSFVPVYVYTFFGERFVCSGSCVLFVAWKKAISIHCSAEYVLKVIFMRFSLLAFPCFCFFWGVVLSFTIVAIMGFSHISTCGERTGGKWFHLEICPWNFKYYNIVRLYQWEIMVSLKSYVL